MYTLVIAMHVFNCIVLCVVVLLQSSKGGGLAGAFGGGGGAPQHIFGPRGVTTILHKVTIYSAVLFFVTSTVLFGLTAKRGGGTSSVVQEAAREGTLTSDVVQPLPSDGPLFPALPTQELPEVEGTAQPGDGVPQAPGSTEPATQEEQSGQGTTPAGTSDEDDGSPEGAE